MYGINTWVYVRMTGMLALLDGLLALVHTQGTLVLAVVEVTLVLIDGTSRIR